MIGEKKRKKQKDLIKYADKPTHQVGWGLKYKVRERRPAQRQARQAKGKRENWYVIKVMKSNRVGGHESLVRQNQRMYRTF